MAIEKATTGLGLLTEGFKLNVDQRGLIVRVGWVVFVSVHIAWICGFLGVVGLQSPFVRAGDIKELVTAQKEAFQSKVDELTDQIALEELRKRGDATWANLDELKLAQMKRRLRLEEERLMKMKEVEERNEGQK